MTGRTLRALLFPLCLFAPACGSGENAKKSCPAKGIGVETPEGVACSTADPTSAAGEACADQIANYKSFACTEPQICSDLGKRKVPSFVVDAGAAPADVSFILTNCSTGNKKLTISKIVLMGDDNCAFTEAEITEKVADPGQEIIIRTKYQPKAEGQDFATIYIYSDAQNANPLIIPICGRALSQSTTCNDAGAGASKVCSFLECKNLTKPNPACHKE
jgi:hypothetical protein